MQDRAQIVSVLRALLVRLRNCRDFALKECGLTGLVEACAGLPSCCEESVILE